MSDDRIDVKEQDRYLPIANISRIMKKSLPQNAKISKEAKECVQQCVSEFIAFVTSEASDKCKQEKRKTINGDDLLWAMGTLGFDRYLEPLKTYLTKYRECAKSDNEGSDAEGLDDKKVDEQMSLGYHQPMASIQLTQMPSAMSPIPESNTLNTAGFPYASISSTINRQ